MADTPPEIPEAYAPGWPQEHMLEAAWGLVANAYDGNWEAAPDEWRHLAAAWRDAYLKQADDSTLRDDLVNVLEQVHILLSKPNMHAVKGASLLAGMVSRLLPRVKSLEVIGSAASWYNSNAAAQSERDAASAGQEFE